MDSKTCTSCRNELPLDSFHINRKGKGGRQARCKACTSALYYQPNKQHVIESTRLRRSTDEGKAREKEWRNRRRRNNPLVRIVQEAKVRATKRGLLFSITAEDLSIPDVCPVLGIPIGMTYGARSDNSLSIDRIDSKKGYVEGNVRIISWRANRLKNDATLDELRAIVSYMENALSAITAVEQQRRRP